ncbi:TPA: YdcF family protein, partial [Cronobacter sakazakii]|nr:YdcF family protein [Cronobacter sakazakii]HAU5483235.1 YdcF family protein [Cronobacter sakazakii]HAV6919150.1 YdcF family protein [Cronobacter sakazakii]
MLALTMEVTMNMMPFPLLSEGTLQRVNLIGA